MYPEGESIKSGPLLEDPISIISVVSLVRACIQVRKLEVLSGDKDLFVPDMGSLEGLDITFNIRKRPQ